MYSEYYNHYTESLLHVFHFMRFQLLHASVDSVKKRLSGSGGVMIRCKDFTRLALDIPNAEDCLNVASSVEALSNIG